MHFIKIYFQCHNELFVFLFYVLTDIFSPVFSLALNKVLSRLASIQLDITEMKQTQQAILNGLQKIVNVNITDLPDSIKLPIETEMELNDLELKLVSRDTWTALVI